MSTKTLQGKLWSIAPRQWSQHFEPWFLPMYRKALELLGTIKTQLLLDAGCGSGMFSSMAIKAAKRCQQCIESDRGTVTAAATGHTGTQDHRAGGSGDV